MEPCTKNIYPEGLQAKFSCFSLDVPYSNSFLRLKSNQPPLDLLSPGTTAFIRHSTIYNKNWDLQSKLSEIHFKS